MRDIHCRGVSLDDGDWQYGSLVIREQDVHGTPGYFISQFGGLWIKVDPDTIGQYLGHEDIDGKQVYEGDALIYANYANAKYVAKWDEEQGGFGIFYKTLNHARPGILQFMKVIGNIYDDEGILDE